MELEYAEEDLPPELINQNGKKWVREKFDTDSYQWICEMEEDEYDWDASELSLVGTDVPIRVVTLQYLNGSWNVEGAETAGPEYHRPGFTEVISGRYSEEFESANEAFEVVKEFIKKLS